jgi:hypothetical protein
VPNVSPTSGFFQVKEKSRRKMPILPFFCTCATYESNINSHNIKKLLIAGVLEKAGEKRLLGVHHIPCSIGSIIPAMC